MKKNNFLRNAKRLTAGLLTAAMVVTMVPSFGGIEARASTLVDNTELDPGAPTVASSGITRVNEAATATGYHSAYDYTTYGQSLGTVYRFGRGAVESNYDDRFPDEDGFPNDYFNYPDDTNPTTSSHAVAQDRLNIHGMSVRDITPNSYQYTFDIGAILDPAKVVTDSRKTFKEPTDTDQYKASKSAYDVNWWSTYIGFGQTGEHKEANPGDMMPVISPRDIKYEHDGFTYPVPGASKLRSKTVTPPDHKVMGIYNDSIGSNIPKGNGRVVEVKIPQTYIDYVNATYGAGTASTGDKIEVRMEVKPTADKQKLLVVWTGYNPNNYPIEFWIGAQADTRIAGTDLAPTIVTADHKRLHMMDYYNQNIHNGTLIPQSDGTNKAADDYTLWTMPKFSDIPNDFKSPDALTDLDIELISGEGRVWAGDNQNPNTKCFNNI